MGQMTRLQIVTEGMLMAGRDNLAVRANIWLQTWLDSVAASWPWPVNIRESLVVPVTAGTNTVSVGGGDSGVTEKIIRILDNCSIFTAASQARSSVRLNQFLTTSARTDAAAGRSMPSSVRTSQTTFGKFTLTFNSVPDQAYLLAFSYVALPVPLGADTDIPWYPNDLTMQQWVTARTLLYDDGPSGAYQVALDEVKAMLANDRIRHGTQPGMNDTLRLDSSVFR